MKTAYIAIRLVVCASTCALTCIVARAERGPGPATPSDTPPRAAKVETHPREAAPTRSLPDLPPPLPDWDYVSRMTFARFPEADRDATLRFLHQHFPNDMQQIKNACATRPDRAMEALTDLVHKGLSLLKTQQNNPALFEKLMRQHRLEHRAEVLAEAASKAQGEARKNALKELQDVLAQAFEIKQDLMKDELEALSRGVNELRTLVEKREENRQAVIERRLIELTGNDDWMRW